MGKRRKIGIIYQYNENWIGGTYYIQNLIKAIGRTADAYKPLLVVFTKQREHFDDLKKTTGYPYLTHRNFMSAGIVVRGVNKVTKKLLGRKFLAGYHTDIDLVFPANYENYFKPKQKFLYWIPDFQEHYLPAFFTSEEITKRKDYQSALVKRAKYIVFSSQSAKKDFNEIYPSNSVSQFVLPFAVTHEKTADDETVIERYSLPKAFFICSNQFWKHKNQQLVLEAVFLLKKKGLDVFVAFTGKEHDYRNPDYFEQLKGKVNDYGIENNIAFLGFISREDQIALMQKSIAVVQPSLFEGWSTVIEDAKALKVNILASDIAVHKEQLADYPVKEFFDPKQASALAFCLERASKSHNVVYNYDERVLEFGKSFQNIADTILQDKL